MSTHAAVDLGASSGRVVLGSVARDRLELVHVARFRNGGVELPGGLHWDVLGLWQDVLDGLARAARTARAAGGAVDSVGVDTWA